MARDQRPPNITPEMFFQLRRAVRGNGNPQVMTNPVWNWLIESRLSAFQANELFHGPSSIQGDPGWCFLRFGQSRTTLLDGRTVLIAGEHEDYYDPDFCIYNDVVLVSPNGETEILGYSPDVFPPTDFHSATLLDRHIVIVGSAGYKGERRAGSTQVATLELDHWRMSSIKTEGVGPGWIHGHTALLDGDGSGLVISGGKVDRGDDNSLVENIDDWRLNLASWRWERLTRRRWIRWEIRRKDHRPLQLWNLRQALFSKEMGWEDAEQQERALQKELGAPVRWELLPLLFRPEIAHEALPEDPDKFGVYRIRIGSVVVRYVESTFSIQVTIEGELPLADIEQIRRDLHRKLEALTQAPVQHWIIQPA